MKVYCEYMEGMCSEVEGEELILFHIPVQCHTCEHYTDRLGLLLKTVEPEQEEL